MDFSQPSNIRLTCARGLGPILAREVEALGWPIERQHPTSVWTIGTLNDCMRLNIELRTAFAVLFEVCEFECNGPDDLYRGVHRLAWEDMIPQHGYFSVMSKVDHPTINNSMFPSLKIKDAIADRFMQRLGSRPDSGPDRHRIVVQGFWRGDRCEMYLNTSGGKLSERGYRKMPGPAPIQEALAAAILLETGYDGTQPLVLPMCGSGTLAIEAALISAGRAPGLLHHEYAFQHLVGFDEGAWKQLRAKTKRKRRSGDAAPIIATDIDPAAMNAAQRNATTAGVEHLIEFSECDFRETRIPDGPGLLIMNPEYGLRLGEEDELRETYAAIGDFFKQKVPGYAAHVLTGNPMLAGCIGLRTSRKRIFHNADIECRLLEFEMYAGSKTE